MSALPPPVSGRPHPPADPNGVSFEEFLAHNEALRRSIEMGTERTLTRLHNTQADLRGAAAIVLGSLGCLLILLAVTLGTGPKVRKR